MAGPPPGRHAGPVDIAVDGVDFLVTNDDQDWRVAWHPPTQAPPGTRHGSTALCLAGGHVVLVSDDDRWWQLPGGRPEGGEDWADTMRREVLEEACADVTAARLLGYGRSVCVRGREEGLVLVRAQWLAEVSLRPWAPEFEMVARRLVAPGEAYEAVSIGPGFEPFIRRMFAAAGLPFTCPSPSPGA
jgi:8-oxo-dGTP pyrophosphatase MutT (NUDIX family)